MVSFRTTALLLLLRGTGFAYFFLHCSRSPDEKKFLFFGEEIVLFSLLFSALLQIFCNFCKFFVNFFLVADFGKEKFLLSKGGFVLCFLHNICEHFCGGGAAAFVVLQRGSWHTQGFFWKVCWLSHRLLLCFSRFLSLFLFLKWILPLGVFFSCFLFYGDRSSCLHARVSRHEGLGKLGRETLSQSFLL